MNRNHQYSQRPTRMGVHLEMPGMMDPPPKFRQLASNHMLDSVPSILFTRPSEPNTKMSAEQQDPLHGKPANGHANNKAVGNSTVIRKKKKVHFEQHHPESKTETLAEKLEKCRRLSSTTAKVSQVASHPPKNHQRVQLANQIESDRCHSELNTKTLAEKLDNCRRCSGGSSHDDTMTETRMSTSVASDKHALPIRRRQSKHENRNEPNLGTKKVTSRKNAQPPKIEASYDTILETVYRWKRTQGRSSGSRRKKNKDCPATNVISCQDQRSSSPNTKPRSIGGDSITAEEKIVRSPAPELDGYMTQAFTRNLYARRYRTSSEGGTRKAT